MKILKYHRVERREAKAKTNSRERKLRRCEKGMEGKGQNKNELRIWRKGGSLYSAKVMQRTMKGNGRAKATETYKGISSSSGV